MITGTSAFMKYGDPHTEAHMTVWDVPTELEIGAIPRKIYCNAAMVKPLRLAISHLITRGYIDELKTWDGCFNLRPIRGYEQRYMHLMDEGSTAQAMDLLSLHSWGIAIDVNASWNKLGAEPTLTAGFVRCFTDAGFIWGGDWKRKDGMHFQLDRI